MKSSRLPIFLFAVLYAIFLIGAFSSFSHLPERVATHFDFSGQPNGWMNRHSLLLVSIGFGFCFPLLPVALCWLVRFVPNGINIPNRDYWLAAQRRRETFDYFVRHAWWFACLAICFVIGLNASLVDANVTASAHLSTPIITALGGGFIVGTGIWIFTLMRHFNRVD